MLSFSAMKLRRAGVAAASAALFTLSFAHPSFGAIIATQKSSAPHPGVTLVEGTTRAPSSKFFAAQIALCTPGVSVDATEPPTANRTVPAWAESVGANLAVNGDFFRTKPGISGLAVGGGKPWPLEQTGVDAAYKDRYFFELYGWIAFGPDFVEFSHTKHVKENPALFGAKEGYKPNVAEHTFPDGVIALVSGFPEVVTEGKAYTCDDLTSTTCFPDRSDMRVRHPRSAMGLTEDRRTFILAVVDGRSKTSAGMNGTELAELMSELGAWQAFNLDGGGSSEMWVRGRGTVNTPSDGTSRPVSNHWGIFNGDGPPGHCLDLAPKPDAGAPDDAGAPTAPDAGQGPAPEPPERAEDEHAEVEPASSGGCALASGARSGSLLGGGLLAVALSVLLRLRRRAR